MLFIDASSTMIEQVQNKIINNKIDNAKAICFNFEDEEEFDTKVNFIIISQTLLHIANIELILSRLFNVLNKDGQLIIVDFDKNKDITSNEVHNGFEQYELGKILTDIGYTSIDSKTFYHGKNMFMGKDASLFILECKR
ncbi:hypothetical protein D3C73_1340750 [compost metagenome]